MDFKTTLKINKQIMALIKGKYPDDFPLAYHNTDATYYERLANDVLKGERCLQSDAPETQATHEEVFQRAGSRQ